MGKGELLKWFAWTLIGVSHGLSSKALNKGAVGEKGRSFCGQITVNVCTLCKTV